MSVLQAIQDIFSVTIVHAADPLPALGSDENHAASCAIVTLSARDSVMEIHELFARSRIRRFVFVAESLPLRPAIARLIRNEGHAVVSIQEPPLVIAATVAALMAEAEVRP